MCVRGDHPLPAVSLGSDVFNEYNHWHAQWLNTATPLFRNVLDETFSIKVINTSVGFRNREPLTC
jgi:hypothetical protein